ncbi:MAG: exodeoxyribonuclease VII large subunit [Gemmataceae bacterium]
MPPLPGTQIFTVTDLTRTLKSLIEQRFAQLWVEGEVSNLARPSSGHIYFTLKDEVTSLKVVVYRGVALRMRFDLTDGMRLLMRGRLSLYEPRGEYQFNAEEVEPKGIGPLELAFRQLKEKLSVLGFFEPSRKKRLPPFPQRIGLVCSPTGSAVRDVLEVLARRWPSLEIWLAPARVQGDVAAVEIAGAISLLNRVHQRIPLDAILLARGGGSIEDLWPFNEELVARAIHRSSVPIVTGVGHEDDLTIADLVADCRALTPTEAAERVTPDRVEVARSLVHRAARLRALLLRNLDAARQQFAGLLARPCLRRPTERIDELRRRVDELAGRLQRSMQHCLTTAQQRLAGAAARLDDLSPLKVLARGYSLTLCEDRVVRQAKQLQPGQRLQTRLESGTVYSIVESVQ